MTLRASRWLRDALVVMQVEPREAHMAVELAQAVLAPLGTCIGPLACLARLACFQRPALLVVP